MENKYKPSGRETFWNIIFSLIFVFLAIYVSLEIFKTGSITNTGFFEFFIISLATFRLIRLFTYDKIMTFFRNLFANRKKGFRSTIHEVLICPWCTGIWMALFAVTLFFLIPLGEILTYILAIAGAGSLIQVFSRMIGRIKRK